MGTNYSLFKLFDKKEQVKFNNQPITITFILIFSLFHILNQIVKQKELNMDIPHTIWLFMRNLNYLK